MNRPTQNRAPRGFTLIELLVVVVIIGALIALLLPAIAASVRNAKSAAVQAEINQFAQALADFKSKFGDYPPSRVMVHEAGGYDNTTSTTRVPSGPNPSTNLPTDDITLGQLAQRSLTGLRKFWPRVPMTSGGFYWTFSGTQWYDFNGNGTFDTSYGILQGHECLVFFLGGIPLHDTSNDTYSMIGFGKSPTNPFSNGILFPANTMYSANRNAPLFEFRSDRLALTQQPSLPTGYSAPLSGIPGYLDTLDGQGNQQSFYAYFSTNLGHGYDPNDVNLGLDEFSASSGIAKPLYLRFLANQPVTPKTGGVNATASASPNPYTTGPTFSPNMKSAVQYQNPQSFQIISAGIDGMYGLGGAYTPNSESPFPSQRAVDNTGDDGVRTLEFDNLTNFHNGRLQ